MAAANRCPNCKATIHPFGATCESCGADLDVHRRRRAAKARQGPLVQLPPIDRDLIEFTVTTGVLLVLALFAPLYGAVFSVFVIIYAHHNGYMARRNAAIACCALGFLLFLSNYAPVPQVTI